METFDVVFLIVLTVVLAWVALALKVGSDMDHLGHTGAIYLVLTLILPPLGLVLWRRAIRTRSSGRHLTRTPATTHGDAVQVTPLRPRLSDPGRARRPMHESPRPLPTPRHRGLHSTGR